MANYLPGSTDFIPSLQSFNPDLNFYAGVLATKQAQYDQGLSKVNSIYNSVFNSPMTREDNILRRDKYFKTIEQSVKKVAGMDLSVDQNINAANTLFDPILNDKNIVQDMIFTKGAHGALGTAEQYRNVVDPDKAGGGYWDAGIQAIQYQTEDYKNASPEEALRMSAPKYVPFQNVTKKAIKAAKEAGFNVSNEYVKGGYNITDENGYLLLGQMDKKGNKISEGILPQYLYGIFGNDGAVQDMYKTQAYVHRKGATKQLAAERGISEDQAESIYLNDIISRSVPKLENSHKALTNQRSALKANSAALEEIGSSKGGIIPGDGIGEAYAQIQNLLEKTDAAEEYHNNVSNLIKTAPNLNDVHALRNRVDGIVANSNFMNTVDAAAAEYAMGTAKHKMEANPYSLASFNNQLDLSKAKQLKDYDHTIWKEQQGLLGNIDTGPNSKQGYVREVMQQLSGKGIGWEELAKEGITPQNFKTSTSQAKLAKLGATTDEKILLDKTFLDVGSDLYLNTYQENAKLTGEATQNALSMTTEYLGDVIKSMRTAYINAASNPDKKKGQVIRDQILSDAKAMANGTGFNPERFLSGTASPKDFIQHLEINSKIDEVNNTFKNIQQNSPAAKVYNANWSTEKLLAMETANQTAHGLIQKRQETQKAASESVLADYTEKYSNGDITFDEFRQKQIMFNSMYDEAGNLRPIETQKELYTKHVTDIHSKKLNALGTLADAVSGITGDPTKLVSAYHSAMGILEDSYDKAHKDFENNYVSVQTNFNNKLTALNSKAGSVDEGGALATEKSAILSASGAQPYSANYIEFKNITKDALKLPIGEVKFSSPTSNPDDINNDREIIGKQFLNDVATGNIKDVSFTYQIQDVPKRYESEIYENTNIPTLIGKNDQQQKQEAVLGLGEFPGIIKPGFVAVKVTVPEEKVRHYLGLKKTDVVDESDKTFIVSIPSNASSLTGLNSRLAKTPTDIYMQTDEAQLTFNLGKSGGFVLKNEGGGLSYTPSLYQLNETTGKIDLVTKSAIPLSDLRTADAIQAAKYAMDRLNSIEEQRQKTYLLLQQAKQQSENAKSR